MEASSIINIVVAAIILVIVGGFYLAYYLKSLRTELDTVSYKLWFNVTQRSDLLPLYIETWTKYFSPESFDELVKLRGESMQIRNFNENKKSLEQQIWKLFEGLMKSAEANPEIKKDVVFAALNKDLKTVNSHVSEQAASYNKLVDKYNSIIRNPLFLPVSMMVSKGDFKKF